MTTSTSSAIDQPTQLTRLKQFLALILPITLGFATLEGVAFLRFGDTPTGLTTGVLFGYAGALLWAQVLARRGSLRAAITIMCTGVLIGNTAIVLLQPALFPSLAIVPLIVVALALPFAGGRVLLRLITVCWMAMVTVALLGEFMELVAGPPLWFTVFLRISTLAAAAALLLLLLWQFSSRLNETLAQTRAAEERYSLAARGANDGLWDWDLVTDRMYFSPRWKAMIGYAEDEISTNPEEWFGRVHPDDRARVKAEIANHRDGLTEHFESEHRLLDANGRYRWMLSRGLAVFDTDGKALRMAGSQTDITNRKQIEEQLLHDAFHDALTGLPNRALLMDRLGRATARAKRHPDYMFSVLFLDLDRFKNINDSLGHSVGDGLLIGLAKRFSSCLRPSDTVARMGGDEFAILLDGVTDHTYATKVASRLQTSLETPFDLHGNEVFTAVSIGIAHNTPEYERPEEILRDADIALYRAKALGRRRYEVFNPAMRTQAVELLQLEMDLRRAIERQEFLVYYQPIVSLDTGSITGFEALVRWQHPQRGILAPADFLGLAEETGLIAPIGWIVLRDACHQLRVWQAHYPEHPLLTLNVNFSANQFQHPDLNKQIDAIFREIATDTRRLRFEITETVMMENAESASATLSHLRALDIQLQIDDFGTGYSSLSTLHHFPIDALKIDRSFVARMGSEGDNAGMIQTIIALAHNLGLEVIAEGVETVDQLDLLRELGCDYAQGYYFSEPVDGKVAGALMAGVQLR